MTSAASIELFETELQHEAARELLDAAQRGDSGLTKTSDVDYICLLFGSTFLVCTACVSIWWVA